MTIALILVSLLVASGRLTVPGHDLCWPGTYEAIAHIWVGFLLAMIVFDEERWTAAALLIAFSSHSLRRKP
jgi:hypothetical protein